MIYNNIEFNQIEYNEAKNIYIQEHGVKNYKYWKPLLEQAKEKNCIFVHEKYQDSSGYFESNINFIYPCKVNIQNYTADTIIGFYYMMRYAKVFRALALKNTDGIYRSYSFEPCSYDINVNNSRKIFSDNYTLNEIIKMSHDDIQYCQHCGNITTKSILFNNKHIGCAFCEIKRTFVPKINVIL